MRLTSVFLALSLLAGSALAFEDTWLKTDDPENASYFSPKMKVTSLNDSLVFWPGVGIGWVVGSVVTVGFEGYALATTLNADGPIAAPLNMAVGGMKFEAMPYPEHRTHVLFNLLIGAGGVQVGGDMDLDSLSRNSFLIVEPGTGLEFNLTRNIRLSPTVSYLWISGAVPGMESKWKISGGAFNLTLRFQEPDGR